MHLAYDLFHMKPSHWAKNVVPSSISTLSGTVNSVSTSDGIESQFLPHPPTLSDIILAHTVHITSQRGNDGNLVRRKCSMKADGCKGHDKACTSECHHPDCLRQVERGHRSFICSNDACKLAHYQERLSLIEKCTLVRN